MFILELYQDKEDKSVFFTYSKWNATADLENYRQSELFKSVWSFTKPKFKNKAQDGALIHYIRFPNLWLCYQLSAKKFNHFFPVSSVFGSCHFCGYQWIVFMGFKGDFNIFDSGFADVTPFFELAPWVLLFLVPAVCMRAFSDEKKSGTLELLLTKPLTVNQIVLVNI